MDLERHGDTLTVRTRRDFNLMAVRHLKYHLEDATRVRVDLSRARLVDTEAVMALFRLQQEGMEVTLLEPPAIFYEVLEVLELESTFDIERLVERERP
jgi:ABC-type transporter Mla MlaB component